ncbi:K+-transporting ATPase ATPase A chain [Methylopila capsulata]|uniref:Potassium-transporting ATPase potassium-binding subunit n=1 Tax=Methylopila capsulata TaxID=61654 RepID=A0A9W6MT10_9HYPH|nr:potassium-transporting ATPase subunit KdpA [Methylopila capsulata]MBM7852684.1 K+-transporting ATPase ATPase A chain [Methylopila capsulata]GLK56893.1 potassium-transporting ATPase potassium-binding subunit [Methylopila capsulata]
MTINGWMQIALFCALVLALTRPLGGFLARLYAGERTFLHPVIGPVESGFYRLSGVRPGAEQGWASYALAMLAFNLAGFAAVYGLLRLQGVLPFNPQGFSGVTPDLALNTAISFVTNTNWQSYGGEATLSYGSQMWALTVQNFVSAATGMAVAVALVRGFARRSAGGLGNFWADLTRSVLYVLLPACILLALVYAALGVPQTLEPYVSAKTLEGAEQTIALGPVASQLAIKMLGTNGGGFFNANSAHPFENPSELANLIQMVSIFAIGAALTNVFGRMVGDERQGWAILGAMGALFLAGVALVYWAEVGANPIHAALGLDPASGNMEGKEVRFGIALSALFAVVTTAASCGAVNAMHDSFSAIGGLIPMLNMQLGEVIVGGVGAGLYGVLLFAVVAVFVAGLMVGRTPEYVGKKIESREVKLTMLALLCSPAATLIGLAIASVSPLSLAGLQESGPHGFSEMLYATTSAAANNGSAFAGLTANAPFWNILLAAGMMIGRFALIVPMLAVAGSLARKPVVPVSAGTFPTHGPLFVGLLVGVILIVGGLTYFPALTLGPVADAFATAAGATW